MFLWPVARILISSAYTNTNDFYFCFKPSRNIGEVDLPPNVALSRTGNNLKEVNDIVFNVEPSVSHTTFLYISYVIGRLITSTDTQQVNQKAEQWRFLFLLPSLSLSPPPSGFLHYWSLQETGRWALLWDPFGASQKSLSPSFPKARINPSRPSFPQAASRKPEMSQVYEVNSNPV